MTNADVLREMSDEELARFACAVGADLWGYCKAVPDEFDMKINLDWLRKEVG